MKNSIVGLSVAVTLLCGFLVFQKNREMDAARARLAAANEKQEALAAVAAQQEQKTKRLQTQLRESRQEALDNAVAAQQAGLQQVRTTTGTNGSKGLSDIFRDDAMKEVLRNEAKVGIERSIRALFKAGLAQQLGLNDDQSAELKRLLTQKENIVWDQMFLPMTTGELDEAGMAAAGRAVKQQLLENTAQLRALLGDNGYNTYAWYEKTQPDRENLNRFNSQAEKSGLALTAEQSTQVLAAMTDERVNFKFQFDPDPLTIDYEHLNDYFSDEKLDIFAQDTKQLNERVVQRAQSVLTPDQAAQLKDVLTREMLHGMMTVRSTKALMAQQR